MIKVGTSGFSFEDWKGTVYPEKLKKEDMLNYYVQEFGFNTLEVNYTYYALPSEKTMAGMERKTSTDFDFVVKAHRSMTHDPFDSRVKEKPGATETEENFKKFVSGLGPLLEKSKLGAVLMQFPVFFYPGPRGREYIEQSREMLGDIPLVVEFRNKGWAEAGTYDFLEKHKIGFCSVDEPQLPRLMPFVERTTADTGYMRFHGRNKNWFNAPLAERYDYMYTKPELEGFIGPIKRMAENSQKEFVFFNNCHSGSAVKNALTMKELLAGT